VRDQQAGPDYRPRTADQPADLGFPPADRPACLQQDDAPGKKSSGRFVSKEDL